MSWTLFAVRAGYRGATSAPAGGAVLIVVGVCIVGAILSPPYLFARYVIGVEGTWQPWVVGYALLLSPLVIIAMFNLLLRDGRSASRPTRDPAADPSPVRPAPLVAAPGSYSEQWERERRTSPYGRAVAVQAPVRRAVPSAPVVAAEGSYTAQWERERRTSPYGRSGAAPAPLRGDAAAACAAMDRFHNPPPAAQRAELVHVEHGSCEVVDAQAAARAAAHRRLQATIRSGRTAGVADLDTR